MQDCVRLTPRNVRRLPWLPPTCGYRLVAEGRIWPGGTRWCRATRETVHEAGVSVRGRVAASENDVPDERAGGVYRGVAGEVAEGGERGAVRGK